MDVLQEPLIVLDPVKNIRYATFFYRMGAVIIDTVIFKLIDLLLNTFHINDKNYLPNLIAVVAIAYKPCMEYLYGGTIGKIVLRLTVVNNDYKKANLTEILKRNIIYIMSSLVLIILLTIFRNDPQVKTLLAHPNYHKFTSFREIPLILVIVEVYSLTMLAFFVIDALFILADTRARALHDRIGRTYVIMNP